MRAFQPHISQTTVRENLLYNYPTADAAYHYQESLSETLYPNVKLRRAGELVLLQSIAQDLKKRAGRCPHVRH